MLLHGGVFQHCRPAEKNNTKIYLNPHFSDEKNLKHSVKKYKSFLMKYMPLTNSSRELQRMLL